MKGFSEIKNLKRPGDYAVVGNALGKSKELVKKIVERERTDTCHVQVAFDVLLTQRENFRKIVQDRIAVVEEKGNTQPDNQSL